MSTQDREETSQNRPTKTSPSATFHQTKTKLYLCGVMLPLPTVTYQDLRQMRYREAWDFQTQLHQSLVANKLNHRHLAPGTYPQQHHLLLVEHPHVYTLGKSGSLDNLLLTETELHERGIDYFPINRGGDITYHGPGQIVGYPILDLEYFFTDVHRYVRSIEEVIIRVLAEYNIAAFRVEGYTGVWVEGDFKDKNNTFTSRDIHFFEKKRKICAIGVHLSRWVTLHGWAFNVNNDLQYFENIIPCGIVDEDKTVTTLATELGHTVELSEVKTKIIHHFAAVFGCTISGTI